MTKALAGVLALIAAAALPGGLLAADARKTVASGQTQVVARVGAREITVTELRLEMARLRLSPNDPQSERIAAESLVQRALLAEAARKSGLARKPEALLRIRAAEDQALADLYLGVASRPAEPTPAEIDDFIVANPSLFRERRIYDLSVLTMPTARFDEATQTPLFDETLDFRAFAAALDKAGVDYSVSPSTQNATTFAAPVREQLAVYGPGDNIVLKGEETTQVLKIVRTRTAPDDPKTWPALARRLLLEEGAAARAGDLVTRLKNEAGVDWYRETAARGPEAGDGGR